jgi:shikimate kinase
MATYLLIGPSGSGKTRSSEIVAHKSDIQVIDLDRVLKEKIGGKSPSDHLAKKGDEYFFNFSKSTILDIIEKSKTDTIIVIGAGSINFVGGHEWYAKQDLISFVGDEVILYTRGDRQRHHPTLQSYVMTEFSMSRKYLYQRSKYRIDVTNLSLEAIAQQLVTIIKGTTEQSRIGDN